MDRRYEVIGGVNITVEDYGGSGSRPVVMVHGLGGSAGNWAMVAPVLAHDTRVVALDLPGHGLSGPAERNDLATHVATVAGLIRKIDMGPAIVVGNSMGGLVSELLAADHPSCVDSMVLISPASRPVEFAVPDRAVSNRLLMQAVPALGPLLTRWTTSRMTPEQQVRTTLPVVMADPRRLPEEGYRRAVALAELRRTMPWSDRAIAESTASIRRFFLGRHEFEAVIGRITVPVTLIFGSADRVVPPSALRAVAAARPDWRTIERPGIGHTAMLEDPALVIEEVRRRLHAAPEESPIARGKG